MEQLGGFTLGGFAAAVVAGGSLHVGMPGEVLGGGDIGAAIEQIRNKRAPQVVRREGGHAGSGRAFGQNDEHGLIR